MHTQYLQNATRDRCTSVDSSAKGQGSTQIRHLSSLVKTSLLSRSRVWGWNVLVFHHKINLELSWKRTRGQRDLEDQMPNYCPKQWNMKLRFHLLNFISKFPLTYYLISPTLASATNYVRPGRGTSHQLQKTNNPFFFFQIKATAHNILTHQQQEKNQKFSGLCLNPFEVCDQEFKIKKLTSPCEYFSPVFSKRGWLGLIRDELLPVKCNGEKEQQGS